MCATDRCANEGSARGLGGSSVRIVRRGVANLLFVGAVTLGVVAVLLMEGARRLDS